jgi:hypothetical protein
VTGQRFERDESRDVGRYGITPARQLEDRTRMSLEVSERLVGPTCWPAPPPVRTQPERAPTALDAFLFGRRLEDCPMIRPPALVTNPRHDLHGFRPEDLLDDAARMRELLGEENFQPERSAEADGPEPDDPNEAPHSLGDLAAAFGLDPQTLRKWERMGIWPQADHYTAGQRGTGTGTGRKRRYTRAQYDGLIELGRQEHLIGKPRRPINSTNFAVRSGGLFQRLAEDRPG